MTPCITFFYTTRLGQVFTDYWLIFTCVPRRRRIQNEKQGLVCCSAGAVLANESCPVNW